MKIRDNETTMKFASSSSAKNIVNDEFKKIKG